MARKLMERFARARANLMSIDHQPLTRAALVVIIFLDFFILGAIFDGLDEHTRQLSSPEDYIPYTCRGIVIDGDWNATNQVSNLSSIVVAYSDSYYLIEEKKKERHSVCAPYLDLLDRIRKNNALTAVFGERNRVDREAKTLRREIDSLKGAYDTSLLETIAKQQEGQSNVDKIRKDVQTKTKALNGLRAQLGELDRKIDEDGDVVLLWARLQSQQQADRERLKADLRNLNFWYPVKKLGMQMIFLLPLFVVLYAWNNVSIRKSRGTQTLVSSHLLVVAFIPIFFKIMEAVYDIIPKKLLKALIDLLVSLKLVAIWHYLVIALSVAAALFAIYIFQKKLFSQEKLVERRITKGQCQQCGKQLPRGAQACVFCGFVQYRLCGSCGKPTHVFGAYCRECGKPQQREQTDVHLQ